MNDAQCNSTHKMSCKSQNRELFDACAYASTLQVVKKSTTSNRASKSSESKQFIEDCLVAAKYTRKQIIDQYLAKFADHKRSTVATYLSDSMNIKYSAFKTANKSRRLTLTRKKDSVMMFRDALLTDDSDTDIEKAA